MSALLALFLLPIQYAHDAKFRLKSLCERHLVADDPFQFEDLTTDQLVSVYFFLKGSGQAPRVLTNEFRRRLRGDMSADDREIVTKVMGVR